ncbi:MAG: fibronectin type III domain-containing protein [Flavobacteriales bacterium]|nr:fibronectin type III domain-containing protein [Flavobacteriales bacterium]
MKTIKIGLAGLSALDKVAKALFIESKLTGNIAFPGAAALLVLLLAARLKLENAIAAALDGGKAATFAKNEAEAELDEIITQIAGYVVSVAGHDEALIHSAGFDVRKPSTPIGDLKAPSNLRADLTDKVGEIQADWDPVYGTHEYEFQRNSVEPLIEANWLLLGMTTKSEFLDKGLASGSFHWYRVRARGTAGNSPWSDPARAMAR